MLGFLISFLQTMMRMSLVITLAGGIAAAGDDEVLRRGVPSQGRGVDRAGRGEGDDVARAGGARRDGGEDEEEEQRG